MIPENATQEEMKHALFALLMTPDQLDGVLECIFKRHDIQAKALGRTAGDDPFHYASTFYVQISTLVARPDVEGLLQRVAREAYKTLGRIEICRTCPIWHYALVVFFGLRATANEKKYYEPPLNPIERERHVMRVAGRLKQAADKENSRTLVLVQNESVQTGAHNS
jgi:hypothetical protein